MFNTIFQWLRKVWFKVIGSNTIQKTLGIELAISDPMIKALELWSKMYVNKASWLEGGELVSMNLPAAIAGEISRVSTVEMKLKVEGSSRADFINEQLKWVQDKMRENVEYGAAKGGLIFKPYIDGDKVSVEAVQADYFYPVEYNGEGRITACVFIDQILRNGKYYIKLEYHSMGIVVDDQGVEYNGYQIINKAYKSDEQNELGAEIPLTEVEEWSELAPVGTIKNVLRPLFGYFRYPLANNVDPTSSLGVSCFSRAVDLVEQADSLWTDLLWEFDSGKRALYLDVLAFGKDEKTGEPYLPNKRLYRTLHGSGNVGDEDMFHEWSPTFREASILNGLDAILRKIEFLCGLDYGRLSNPETVDKTAKEISSSQQRFFSTIRDVQKALENALDDLIYAIDVWTTVGKLHPRGSYNVAIEFDDSIVVDKDTQFDQDSRALALNVMDRVEFRMRNYGEDLETATAKINAIKVPETDFFE